MSLFAASASDVPLSAMYADSVGLALAVHLASKRLQGSSSVRRELSLPLAKWRLRRSFEYIDAHLTRNISLEKLSTVARLGRIYFAAQFRSAMGLSPHSYILERRLSIARPLLVSQNISIDEVAQTTGFYSKAHFIRAFNRHVGSTPGRWLDVFGRHGFAIDPPDD